MNVRPVEDITVFTPELVLAGAAIVVLLLDLYLRGAQKRWLPVLTIVGLGAFGLSVWLLWPAAEEMHFEFWRSFVLDRYALFFKGLFAVAGILTVLLATDFLRGVYSYGEFFVLLLFVTFGMALLSGAVDLITIYLAFELISLSSYVLAGYRRRDPKSNEAALKYFVYGAVASAIMIYGISLLYGLGGSTNLFDLTERLGAGTLGPLHALAFILILAGLGYKIAMAPFHAWCPDVYEGAPTAVTAFLSVGPKAAGFALLTRFVLLTAPSFVPQWQVILAVLATLTMFVGNLLAIRQQNVKRLLAYSSIAHAGYMLIGVIAAGSQPGWGLAALFYYFGAYVLMNLGAFAVLMIVAYNTGSEELSGFAGLARHSLGTALIMVVFLLSLTGIPPTAGFVGKLCLFGAAIQSGTWWWLAVVGIINSVISLYYYMNIARQMFFVEGDAAVRAQPMPFGAVMWLCLVGTLVLGVLPQGVLATAARAASLAMGGL